jgi:ABC-type sugar transport system ATPase subunit
MIGQGGFESLVSHVQHVTPSAETPRLEVHELRSEELNGVSLTAYAGQIVGLAGLEGGGTSTVLRLLFGIGRPESGTVTFPDGKGLPRDATAAARRGISMVPADRRNEGLMLHRPVATNVGHVVLGALRARTRIVTRSRQAAMAKRQIERLRIVATPWMTVDALSGGNQQKVVLGKWLEASPRVLLLDDPTRGVDIGAKREIYRLIRRMSGEGQIVLVTSTELPELCELADRIVVLYRGRAVGEFGPGEANPGRLLHAVNTGQLH